MVSHIILHDAGAVPYRSHKAHDYHWYHYIDHLRALLVRTNHAHHADYLFTPFDLTRFLFPDSPTTAWFLTPGERVAAIRRIQVNQSGVENKHFKKEQWVLISIVCDTSRHSLFGRFLETIKDPRTWLMAFFAGSAYVFDPLYIRVSKHSRVFLETSWIL